jgi:hypothetical protein
MSTRAIKCMMSSGSAGWSRFTSPHGGFCAMVSEVQVICPTCQPRGIAKGGCRQGPATLHGVVFMFLIGSEDVVTYSKEREWPGLHLAEAASAAQLARR